MTLNAWNGQLLPNIDCATTLERGHETYEVVVRRLVLTGLGSLRKEIIAPWQSNAALSGAR